MALPKTIQSNLILVKLDFKQDFNSLGDKTSILSGYMTSNFPTGTLFNNQHSFAVVRLDALEGLLVDLKVVNQQCGTDFELSRIDPNAVYLPKEVCALLDKSLQIQRDTLNVLFPNSTIDLILPSFD